ncbi:MAG TPA: mechanosensitive ion channel [Candidatus Avibacteroides excrementipullorum]|jgi:small conductance mechanosensitive channel|nr:mechanosensitive ion channel [Candidatus Avibacteroides excrementipullorum]
MQETVDTVDRLSVALDKLTDFAISGGEKILVAVIVFIVGRLVIKLIKKLTNRILERRKFDPGVKSFLGSMINIVLMTLLIISVIGALGVNTASFAALLASAGVAIGMALSGQLQNFAGGLIILIFRPYRVGDYISAQGIEGVVKEIQILYTIINTTDNKMIFVPNGGMSNGLVINYSRNDMRRVDLVFGVEYGTAFEKVESVLKEIIASNDKILNSPEPAIAMSQLADSSVNISLKVWTKTADYWDVYFFLNKTVYATFNEKGISFPFPQLTIHRAE